MRFLDLVGFNFHSDVVTSLTSIIGVKEGKTLIEQVVSDRRENIIMAKHILGRFNTLALTLKL